MARMFPERLPRSLTDDPKRQADVRVYARLRDTLDDHYVVLQGVPYLVEDRQPRYRDGEIDFLVDHPALGLLMIEVKGGGIA